MVMYGASRRRAPKRLLEREEEIQKILVSLKSKGEGALRRENWSIVNNRYKKEKQDQSNLEILLDFILALTFLQAI